MLISKEDFLEFLPTLCGGSYENGMEGEPTFLDDKAGLGLGGLRDPGTSEADAARWMEKENKYLGPSSCSYNFGGTQRWSAA